MLCLIKKKILSNPKIQNINIKIENTQGPAVTINKLLIFSLPLA